MKSVIIIEDDNDASKTLADICEINGIKVLASAYDGNEAIEIFKQYQPDVVLLDIMMPKYDGFYAIDGIRKVKQDAKIVAVTASVDQDTQDKLTDLGIPIIFKPYEISDIVNAVNSS
jgi:DNA-binding response OmpR family regulator